jgi:hypothetical protein
VICFILNREKCSTVPTAFLLHNISKGMKRGKQRMLALNCLKVLCYCDKCSSFLTSQKVPHDVVGFISTHYVFLRAGLIFTRFYTMRFLVPYLLIEEYESQEWARHRPLVTAIFKHDHIQNSTQDLL